MQAFLDAYLTLEKENTPTAHEGVARAQRKRDDLRAPVPTRSRVAPWHGTAHGVLQAVNTYEHMKRRKVPVLQERAKHARRPHRRNRAHHRHANNVRAACCLRIIAEGYRSPPCWIKAKG